MTLAPGFTMPPVFDSEGLAIFLSDDGESVLIHVGSDRVVASWDDFTRYMARLEREQSK